MGLTDWIKRKLSRDKPTYDVYIPSKKEKATGTTIPKSYPTKFIGPVEKTAVRVDAPGITTTVPTPTRTTTTRKTTGTTSRLYSGPTQLGTDVKEFRKTGITTGTPTPTPTEIKTPIDRRIQPLAVEEKGLYAKAEDWTSKKVYGATGFSQEQHDIQRKRVLESESWLQERASRSTQTVMDWGAPEWMAKSFGGIAAGGIKIGTLISGGVGTLGKATMDKPITTGVTSVAVGIGIGAGTGFAIPAVTAAAGKVPVVGGVLTKTVPVVATGLGAVYVGKVGMDVYKAPTTFEQGGILAMEAKSLAAMGIGFKLGQKGYTKSYDWWRTRGTPEIPIKEVVLPEVLSGKDTFVESKHYGYKGKTIKQKQEFDIKVFEKEGGMYHATGEKFWGKKLDVTQPGTSEFAGLYGAPSPSVYFLRGGGETPKFKLIGTGKVTSPSIARIKTQFDITKVGRTSKKGKAGMWEFLGKLERGKAYVSGIKPEIEAVIPVSTSSTFIKTGSKGYVKYAGRRIPIDVFTGDVTGGITGAVVKTPKGLSVSKLKSSYKMDFGKSTIIYTETLATSFIDAISKKRLYSPSKKPIGSYIAPTVETSKISYYKPSMDYYKITPTYEKPSSGISDTPSSIIPGGDSYSEGLLKTSDYIPPVFTYYSEGEKLTERTFKKPEIYTPSIGKMEKTKPKKTREMTALGSSFAAWAFKIKAPTIGTPHFGELWSGMEIKPLTTKGRIRAQIKIGEIKTKKKIRKKPLIKKKKKR